MRSTVRSTRYVAFVMDTMRWQIAFERELVYPDVSYDEAAQLVFLDESYIPNRHLPGLPSSRYLWPHHFRFLRCFDWALAAQVEAAGVDQFTAVSVGTGIYSHRLLLRLPAIRGTGYDVRPAVQKFAALHLAGFGVGDRNVHLEDVTTGSREPASWIVCVELPDHMEDAVELLAVLRQLLRGRAFTSTALNAPTPDHNYLYRDPSEVIVQLEQAGLALEQSFCAPEFAPRPRGAVVPSLAAFIVA